MAARRPQEPSDPHGLSVESAHHFARVYGPARAGCLRDLRCAGCSEEEAEDIFSTVLEQIMRRRDPVGDGFGQAQTVALLRKACREKLIDERRLRAVLRLVPLRDAEAKSDPTAMSAAERAEARETVAIGREAIASLPERDRRLFLQRHHLGLSPEEILSRNPGLSRRTYRKIMQRANARALAVLGEIGSGARCAALRDEQLRRFLAEEAGESEQRAVRLHLARCRACRHEAARMRGHLHELAAGLSVVLGAEVEAPADRAARLLDSLGRWVEALASATRGSRERLRELAIKATGVAPGSGEGAVGQLAGLSTAKAASLCVGAVTAGCVAAGVVPGVGAIDLVGPERDPRPVKSRNAEPLSPPSPPRPSPKPLSPAEAKRPAPAGARSRHRSPRPPGRGRARREGRSSPTISGQQTGTELGAEAAGAGVPAPTYSTGPSGSSPLSAGSSSPSNGGARSASQPEFGL